MTQLVTQTPTMSSLELVDYINAGRKAHADAAGASFPSKGHSELLHRHFLKKIEAHPGFHSDEFSSQYTDSTGRSLKCYQLPEREARLMVMAESLEVQTKVLDRVIELERGCASLQLTAEAIRRIESDYAENLKHHPNYELGERLKEAIRMEDYDNVSELNKMLDKMDFTRAANLEGVPVGVIRRRVAMHTVATMLLGTLERGEHEHESPVKNVVEWARATVQVEDAQAKMLAFCSSQAKRALTLEQIDANDLANKH